jgi:hypothetical protein
VKNSESKEKKMNNFIEIFLFSFVCVQARDASTGKIKRVGYVI